MTLKFRVWLIKEKKMVPVWQMWFDQKYGETRAMVKSPKTGKFIINDFPIMQSLGFVDKNGKEIYENDFLKISIPPDYPPYICKAQYCDYFALSLTRSKLEVIGNIYENPELLMVAK